MGLDLDDGRGRLVGVRVRVLAAAEPRHHVPGQLEARLLRAPPALDLLRARYASLPRGPFNLDARYAAGFSKAEMDALESG